MGGRPDENDGLLLTDYLLGQCDPSSIAQVENRLERDEEFRTLHRNISNALLALKLLPENEPPSDLVERTLWRVRAARQTEALLAREQLGRRVFAPTFTLRELGALAAAVVLLAVILVPGVRQSRRIASLRQCTAQVGQIGTALQTYATEYKGYLPQAGIEKQQWLPAAGKLLASNSANLFALVKGQYASPALFECPGVGRPEGFVIQPGMDDFPAAKYVHYSYQHSLGGQGLSIHDAALTQVADQMAILGDSSPVFPNGRFARDRVRAMISDNHGGIGQSVLYLSGHVLETTTADAGVNGNNIFLAEGIQDYIGNETPASRTDTFLLPAYSQSR